MDYGKRAPELNWRMTGAWLSMAGAGSKALPDGVALDEWGIRMEPGICDPVGAPVPPTVPPLFTPSANKMDGCANRHRQRPPAMVSINRCRRLPKAM